MPPRRSKRALARRRRTCPHRSPKPLRPIWPILSPSPSARSRSSPCRSRLSSTTPPQDQRRCCRATPPLLRSTTSARHSPGFSDFLRQIDANTQLAQLLGAYLGRRAHEQIFSLLVHG